MRCPRLSRQRVPVFLGLVLGLLGGCTHSSREPLSPHMEAWQAKRHKDQQDKGERVVRAADPAHTEGGLVKVGFWPKRCKDSVVTPECCPSAPALAPAPAPTPKPPDQPAQPPQPQAQPPQEPSITPEQFAATGMGESFAAGAPNVIGDGGVQVFCTSQTSVVGSGTATSSSTITKCFSIPEASPSAQLAARAGSYKISENESPRPQNRVFFDYNYFANVNGLGPSIHREMPGFEYAPFDGNASLGLRVPVFQDTNGSFNLDGFGDLHLLGKYAWLNDRQSGNVFSNGLVLTVPTGRGIKIPGQSDIKDTVFQPWFGGIYAMDRFYVQGFSACAIPTDQRDIVFYFNDFSTGFWVVRNNQESGLTGLVPTLEAHVINPLNHRGLNTGFPVGAQDSVVLTGGVHFIFAQRFVLTVGVVTPVTGPIPFDVEGLAMVNYIF